MTAKAFAPGGVAHIRALIDRAIQNESRTATVTGNWEIDEAIRLPSNFTLILDGCHLRLADGSFTNLFVNEHHGTELGRTVAGTDRNVSILGRNGAILDGGSYNGLSEKTQNQNGMPPIWKNNLVLFTNVDGFTVRGIHCRNQRWWALNFLWCANGYLGDLDFCASDLAIDEDGNEYHGLLRDRYADVVVKNADGIDLRCGCHDIVIENVTGFTEDDTVALTALRGSMEQQFAVEGRPDDICRVQIRNVRASAYCSIVRLLNQGGTRLHDIVLDGVYDTSRECPHLDHGRYAVRIGDGKHLYGSRHSTADETYNITVKNVYGRGICVLALAGAMENVVFYGIEAAEGTRMLLDERN